MNIKERILNIVKNVENMTNEEFLKVVSSMARFYQYSFYNRFLLALQKCSQVAGYRKWQEMGRYVKKGEKAKLILAPRFKKVTKMTEEGEEETFLSLAGFLTVPVFDISQTEGDPIEKNFTTVSNIEFDVVVKAAEKLGCKVKFEALEIALGGYVMDNTIVLNSNLNKTENTGTLIHELAHFVLGHTMERDYDSKASAEQEAETVTALICAEYGIERKSTFYLKGWGTENILKALPKLTKAHKKIKDAIDGVLGKELKNAEDELALAS